jgi:hypothetical protein
MWAAEQMPHVPGAEPHIDASNAAAGQDTRTGGEWNHHEDGA